MPSLKTLPGEAMTHQDLRIDGDNFTRNLPERANVSESTKHNSCQKLLKTACPPRGWPVKYLTWALVLGGFVGALWSIMPKEMSPHHDMFGLVITILLCIAAEQLVVKIPTPRGYPPPPQLFASLLMGLLLRNVPPPGNIALDINQNVSSILRKLALTVILTRAGLEIDPQAMKKIKWAVIRLAFSPCLVETICVGVLAHYLLEFSLIWSFMLGFVIAAVSPAVVIPSLIILQDLGYGVAKGIPSLVMAASGIDDVLAITGFTILLGIAIPSGIHQDFISVIENLIYGPSSLNASDSMSTISHVVSSLNSTMTNFDSTPHMVVNMSNVAVTQETFNNTELGDNLQNITSDATDSPEIGKEIGGVVIEVAIGILSGLLFGLIISYIPFRGMRYKSFCRGFLLLSIGIFMVFGTALWSLAGAGTLCALIMSFTASLKWKEEAVSLAKAWHYMWVVFQPILFGLTGTLVDVSTMDGSTIGLGLAVLSVSLVARLLTSTSVTFGLRYNLKERIFVSVAWIPKGTVQAALCSAALDQAVAQHRSKLDIYHATQILVLAVLITLITAPIGAFAISVAGPRLLSNSSPNNPNNDSNESCSTAESTTTSTMKRGSVQDSVADSGIEFYMSESSNHFDEHECKDNLSFESESESTVL